MRKISYERYLRFRGYDTSKWQIFKKGFVDSWTEPGFHRFWQTWNPQFGYLLALVYLNIGGSKRKVPATLGVFLISGLWHDLLVFIILRRSFYGLFISFLIFGCLVLVSRKLESSLKQSSWPKSANISLNIILIASSFIAGGLIKETAQSFFFR